MQGYFHRCSEELTETKDDSAGEHLSVTSQVALDLDYAKMKDEGHVESVLDVDFLLHEEALSSWKLVPVQELDQFYEALVYSIPEDAGY